MNLVYVDQEKNLNVAVGLYKKMIKEISNIVAPNVAATNTFLELKS